MVYDYQFNPYAGSEHHLLWTDGTLLSVSAGVGGIGLWRRRRA